MQLYVVRHGLAIAHEDPKCPSDAERYLTEEGIEKTKQVAKGVAAFGTIPDLLLSSPYVRALQTAEIFAHALDYPKVKIRQTDLLLPGGEVSLFFREIAKNKQSAVIFCFGHGPQVDNLVAAALGTKQQVTALKKAGVALVELRRVSPPSGKLLWLGTPKMLRCAGK